MEQKIQKQTILANAYVDIYYSLYMHSMCFIANFYGRYQFGVCLAIRDNQLKSNLSQAICHFIGASQGSTKARCEREMKQT